MVTKNINKNNKKYVYELKIFSFNINLYNLNSYDIYSVLNDFFKKVTKLKTKS